MKFQNFLWLYLAAVWNSDREIVQKINMIITRDKFAMFGDWGILGNITPCLKYELSAMLLVSELHHPLFTFEGFCRKSILLKWCNFQRICCQWEWWPVISCHFYQMESWNGEKLLLYFEHCLDILVWRENMGVVLFVLHVCVYNYFVIICLVARYHHHQESAFVCHFFIFN